MALNKWKESSHALDIRYYDENGNRSRLRLIVPTQDERIAQQIHDTIACYLRSGGPKPVIRIDGNQFEWDPGKRPKDAGIYTIADLAQAYKVKLPLDINRELRPNTLYVEGCRINKIIESIGDVPIENAAAAVYDFAVKLRDQYATQTRYHYHTTLDHMFHYGVKVGVLDQNPMVEISKPTVTHDPIYPLTRDELDDFLAITNTISPVWATFFQFAAATGLRCGELRGLMQKDIGHLHKVVHVARSTDRKGNITPTKSKKNRYVPLTSMAQCALLEIESTHPNAWLFTTPKGNQVLQSSYRKTFVKARHELARPYPLRFHDLRHTFATLALSAGISMQRVSKWMGHASVTTTERIYDGMTAMSDGVQDDIKRFDSFWDNDRPKKGHFGTTSSSLIDIKSA